MIFKYLKARAFVYFKCKVTCIWNFFQLYHIPISHYIRYNETSFHVIELGSLHDNISELEAHLPKTWAYYCELYVGCHFLVVRMRVFLYADLIEYHPRITYSCWNLLSFNLIEIWYFFAVSSLSCSNGQVCFLVQSEYLIF